MLQCHCRLIRPPEQGYYTLVPHLKYEPRIIYSKHCACQLTKALHKGFDKCTGKVQATPTHISPNHKDITGWWRRGNCPPPLMILPVTSENGQAGRWQLCNHLILRHWALFLWRNINPDAEFYSLQKGARRKTKLDSMSVKTTEKRLLLRRRVIEVITSRWEI